MFTDRRTDDGRASLLPVQYRLCFLYFECSYLVFAWVWPRKQFAPGKKIRVANGSSQVTVSGDVNTAMYIMHNSPATQRRLGNIITLTFETSRVWTNTAFAFRCGCAYAGVIWSVPPKSPNLFINWWMKCAISWVTSALKMRCMFGICWDNLRLRSRRHWVQCVLVKGRHPLSPVCAYLGKAPLNLVCAIT